MPENLKSFSEGKGSMNLRYKGSDISVSCSCGNFMDGGTLSSLTSSSEFVVKVFELKVALLFGGSDRVLF